MASFKEVVSLKREVLKKCFPDYKFSIRKVHSKSLHVSILEGPVKLTERDYEQINYYYAKDHACSPEAGEILAQVAAIMLNGNYTVSVDGDYGNIPNYYVHLEVGQWDKPYRWLVGGLKISVNKEKLRAKEKAEYLAQK